MGWETRFQNNDPSYLEPRISNAESSLADKASQTDLTSETSNRQSKDSDLQTQVNNLVLGAVGSGNNAEVVQARANYLLLNDRLTAHSTKLDSLDSAVTDGIAKYSNSGSVLTNTNIISATTSATTNTTGYTNGFIAPTDIYVTKIKLNSSITTTSFYLYVADANNNLLQSSYLASPVITNYEFPLDTPLYIPKGGKLYIRFYNGTWYYYRHTTSDIQEYRATAAPPAFYASPVQAGFDIYYAYRTIQFSGNSGIYESLMTSIDVGLSDPVALTDADGTTYSIATLPSTVNNPNKAYSNGFTAPYSLALKSVNVQIYSSSPVTSIGVYVFNGSTLISHTAGITVTNGVATLSSAVFVKKGYSVYICFENGTFYYSNTGVSDKQELTISGLTISTSPILAGFNLVYSKLNFTFKTPTNNTSTVKLTDSLMPKYQEITGLYGYIGRWWDKVVSGTTYKATNNQGSQICFKVSGTTSINVNFDTITAPTYTPYFAYSLDGASFVRQKISSPSITLPDTSDHIIRIIVDGMGENDPIGDGKWLGSVGLIFKGIDVGSGSIKGLLPINREIAFIGDSITEGINVLGTGATADTNSASGEYSFICSQQLNAIPYFVGYGGSGVLSQGSFHPCIDAINYYYNGVPTGTDYVDVIVMAHGYNDNTLINNGTYTSTDFINAYNKVLDRLKVKFPGVPIVCLVPFGAQAIEPYIKSCITNRSYCYIVESSGWSITTSDGVHPNSTGAVTLGTNLANAMVNIFGKQFFMV